METAQEAGEKAHKSLSIADHLLTQSYPLIQDPKLLLAVAQNIFSALTSAMAAILAHEYESKRLRLFPASVEARFDLFKLRVAPRYKIAPEYLQLILEAKSLLHAHQEASVTFARKDALVICEEGYRLKTLTSQDMKAMYAKAKAFIQQIDTILSSLPEEALA